MFFASPFNCFGHKGVSISMPLVHLFDPRPRRHTTCFSTPTVRTTLPYARLFFLECSLLPMFAPIATPPYCQSHPVGVAGKEDPMAKNLTKLHLGIQTARPMRRGHIPAQFLSRVYLSRRTGVTSLDKKGPPGWRALLRVLPGMPIPQKSVIEYRASIPTAM